MKIGKSALAYLSMFALTSFKYFLGLKHTRKINKKKKEDLINPLLKDHSENMLKRTLK